MQCYRPYWEVRHAGLAAMALVMGMVLPGCREELGPVSFPSTRVVGVVREGGRPVGGGWIEFVPVEGTVGNLRSVPIAADGRFEATRVAVGRNLIGLINPPIAPDSRQLFHTYGRPGSPIRRNIPPGPVTTMELDLMEEAIRYRAASERGTGDGGRRMGIGKPPGSPERSRAGASEP